MDDEKRAIMAVMTGQNYIPAPRSARYDPAYSEMDCLVCGKAIRDDERATAIAVHLAQGGASLVSKDVPESEVASDMGFHPVGPGCARKIPARFKYGPWAAYYKPNHRSYNSRGVAGLVTRVGDMSIYVAAQAGIDADPETPWVAVCEKHGSMMPCATRKQARATIEEPEWCEECVGYEANHSAVYYVWVLDYRGVPLDSEGPYGSYTLDRAKQFARISATEGEHDRAVSHGGNPDAESFEIVRHYRRGTGERLL